MQIPDPDAAPRIPHAIQAIGTYPGLLDIQVNRLIELGYPDSLGMSARSFQQALAGLACHLRQEDESVAVNPERGRLPFALVINMPGMPVRTMIPLINRREKGAVERLHPIEPERFRPVEGLGVPEGHAYLLFDVDRGMDTRNVTPDAALITLQARERSPLTVEEGMALLTQFPEFLQPNHCFSMLGSRCGDKRVPALWLSDGHPKLGWCWAGNPHTWLGSASCKKRSPAVDLTKPPGTQ